MTNRLSDQEILDFKKDGVILIKGIFAPWIEKLKIGFEKVLKDLDFMQEKMFKYEIKEDFLKTIAIGKE